MIVRRIATTVATLLAVSGAGACSAARTETTRTEPRPTGAAATGPITAARAPLAGVRLTARDSQNHPGVRNVPSAFRLPPGSSVTALSDRESGASFTLTTPDPAAVLSFYRNELPRDAFTIVTDRTEHDATSLAFRDADGWAGTIYATKYRVTVAVRRA